MEKTTLIQSRRFITFCVDVVVSIVLFFASKVFDLNANDVRFLIIMISFVSVALIAAYTVDDINRTLLMMTRLNAETLRGNGGNS